MASMVAKDSAKQLSEQAIVWGNAALKEGRESYDDTDRAWATGNVKALRAALQRAQNARSLLEKADAEPRRVATATISPTASAAPVSTSPVALVPTPPTLPHTGNWKEARARWLNGAKAYQGKFKASFLVDGGYGDRFHAIEAGYESAVRAERIADVNVANDNLASLLAEIAAADGKPVVQADTDNPQPPTDHGPPSQHQAAAPTSTPTEGASSNGPWVTYEGDYTATIAPNTRFLGTLRLTGTSEALSGTLTTNSGRAAVVTGTPTASGASLVFTFTDSCGGKADAVASLVGTTLSGSYHAVDCNGAYDGAFLLMHH